MEAKTYSLVGFPTALMDAAEKMEVALKSGVSGDALRKLLAACTREVWNGYSSTYRVHPRDWHSEGYHSFLLFFGRLPFRLSDISELFRMEFLSGFTQRALMKQRLLPVFFINLPFLKRVEICAVWARKCPEVRAILLTWFMALWGYDCCSSRIDEDRDLILRLGRLDSLRTVLRFVKHVESTCATDMPLALDAFVEKEFEERELDDGISAEKVCRNEDWVRSGACNPQISTGGMQSMVEVLHLLEQKGSAPFTRMVRLGDGDDLGVGADRLLLYLVAKGYRFDDGQNKVLRCVKALVKRYPEVLKARDRSGDGPLWQMFYSAEYSGFNCLPEVTRYLVRQGCDPDEKSSVGVSYAEVMKYTGALVFGGMKSKRRRSKRKSSKGRKR